jgi:hypothetical protein
MRISQAKLDAFEQAVQQSAAPPWDPNFEVTKALLSAVALQTRRIYMLERSVERFRRGANSDAETIRKAMLRSLNSKVTKSSLGENQVNDALAATDQVIKSVKSGARITAFAGSVLKLVSKLVL